MDQPERFRRVSDHERAVQEAVTRLIEVAGVRLDRGGPPDQGEVLLDLTVGPVRCVLMPAPPAVQPMVPSLTPRESEIARMVSRGYTNRTIAAVLEISLWTVSTHLRRIYAKLAVTSRAAMVAKIMESHEAVPPAPGAATASPSPELPPVTTADPDVRSAG
jgi:DNA-binding CsgD family transcriptional regulator